MTQPSIMRAPPDQARVLCVDDEPMVLSAMRRTLGGAFDVETAAGGEAAVSMLGAGGAFAAVIADLRMPGMDGAATLAEFARRAPDTSRIMLTGHGDIDVAMRAVNSGKVFKFLSKPCPPEKLIPVLQQAVAQHRAALADRELLDRALGESVSAIAGVVGLASPVISTRTEAVRRIVKQLAERLGLKDAWKLDLAARLSRIGCVSLSSEALERHFSGQPLSPEDQAVLDANPEVAFSLLAKIPKLEEVAEIIHRQKRPATDPTSDDVGLGAALLRLAVEFDRRLLTGEPVALIRHQMSFGPNAQPFELLKLLRDYQPEPESISRAIRLSELQPGMVLADDVLSGAGTVLVSKGFNVTPVVVERLRHAADGIGVKQPLMVRWRTRGTLT